MAKKTRKQTRVVASPIKLDCEIRTPICSNQIVRKMTVYKKGDPVFNCCCACLVYCKKGGVRLREAPGLR